MFNIFHYIKDSLRLRDAIQRADKAYAENKQRYYVMPVTNGQLIVMDRDNFRILKRKRYIPQNTTMKDVVRECFYCTPYANGSEPMPRLIQKLRAANYHKWCQQQRKQRKANRKKVPQKKE